MGCDQSQGYLHSRPLGATDLEPLLKNGIAIPGLQKSNVTSLDRTVAVRGG